MSNYSFNPHREYPYKPESFPLCHYLNETPNIQVVRIANVPHWYFEKVIFPQEHLFFFAPPTALLEIYMSQTATTLLSEKISCDRLVVSSKISPSIN